MNPEKMPPQLLKKVFEQAEREYPNECCGMILGPRGKRGELSRVRPCRNVQDVYHQQDPKNFPRPARTAYFIEPKELLAIQKEARTADEEIRVIYHSHMNAGAYFSEEDTRVALPEGEPAYPGVDYLVVSVRKGKAVDSNIFRWDGTKKEFVKL